MLPGNPPDGKLERGYLDILRDRLDPADANALDRLTHFACEVFKRRPFTEAIFADLDPWLRTKCPEVNNKYVQLRLEETGHADVYGLTLLGVADLLEAEVNCDQGAARRPQGNATLERNSREGIVLGVLMRNGVTSKARRWTTRRIEHFGQYSPGTLKRTVSKLVKRKLVKSLPCRGGGVWLTQQGQEAASNLASSTVQ